MFEFSSDIKIAFAILSAVFMASAYFPYLKGMLAGKTKPHVYTWLIWTLTTGTATVALWYGGGGYGAASYTFSTFLTFIFFLLSFRYGTKNITKSDTVILILALVAIVVWWSLHNPLLAVFMVTAIDGFAYLPSFRKTFEEPWSEPIASWIMFTLGNLSTLIALREYNLLTVTYILMSVIANIILVCICIFRRPVVQKPSF